MSILGAAALTFFPLVMAFAAFSDLFTMTISNKISIALVAVFIAFAWIVGLPLDQLVLHLAVGFGVLTLTFLFFARGWIGGGDAKLAAATAVWLGWENLADYGLQASVLGAILTVGILLARKRTLPAILRNRGWIVRLHQAGTGVPYGVALAVSGLCLYPNTAIWQLALGA